MTINSLDVFLSCLELVHCSMSCSNCCLLTCIQISQEAGKVVWYSHLLKNFPQFVVIYTVKGFSIANKAEMDVFMELSCFFYGSVGVGNLISDSSVKTESHSVVSNSATPWTTQSMEFSRSEYWSGLSCPPPEDLPNPGIEAMSLMSPALAGEFFTTRATREVQYVVTRW